MPVIATKVERAAVAADATQSFSQRERDYVRGLKRREQSELFRVLQKKRKSTAPDVPLRIQVLQSRLPDAARLAIFQELRFNASDKYVAWVGRALQIPLGVHHMGLVVAGGVHGALVHARAALDAAITGHHAAKAEILKLVCHNKLTPQSSPSTYSLGFEGPPGTGKTHMVRNALAPALGRPLVSIPLGGAADVSFLLGSLYTYEGSREGRLVTGLIEAGCANPIFHFDEVDKISSTERGAEITRVLIHLIDGSANSNLRDRYFHGIDIDFSGCTFVFSYNNPANIDPILLDRIKRVPVPTPTAEERHAIVRDHLLPRTQRRLNTTLAFSKGAIELLLDRSCGGMRGVEKEVEHVLAAAQLSTVCPEAAPHQEETPTDGDGAVTREFAQECLESLAGAMRSAPPMGMYN
jgi:ATP-dependent Lon protease